MLIKILIININIFLNNFGIFSILINYNKNFNLFFMDFFN